MAQPEYRSPSKAAISGRILSDNKIAGEGVARLSEGSPNADLTAKGMETVFFGLQKTE
jgi:hypothetical protein